MGSTLRGRTVLAAVAAFACVLAGCSAVPNLDRGSAGCANTSGPGPSEGAVPFRQALIGRSPADAAAIVVSLGHVAVFNVQIPGYGECWCDPPPEGRVIDAWWGGNGQLYLQVDGVDEGHSAENQPLLGWGC